MVQHRPAGTVTLAMVSGSLDAMGYRRKSLRSQLYRGARELGNAEAAAKGPVPYTKRVVRRNVYRSTNRVTGSFLRRLGL